MAIKPFVFVFAILSLLSLTTGCTCAPQTFRQHYKRAKIVVKAKLISTRVSPTPTPLPCRTAFPPCLLPDRLTLDRKFKFKLLQTFKGCPPGKFFRGKSFTSDGLCGISLKVGRIYLLFLDDLFPDVGGVPDSFNLNICQGIRRFKQVNNKQRAFLRRAAKKPENGCLEEE